MFLISTLFNSICLHKFSHHLSIMMILPAIKSNLCNPLKENCKNMQSSNYTSYRVICKHRRAVSQIEGDGNISNLIIIAIVQHDDNVDGGRLRSWVSEWRDDGMTKWRNDWMTSWLTEWMTDWSWPDNMPIASTTLGDDTSVQLYAASGFRRSESGSGRHFSWMGERLLGVCHVVYWPVCVSPVHIWIFVAILMNFQGWPRVRGGGAWRCEPCPMSGRTTWLYRMRQWVPVYWCMGYTAVQLVRLCGKYGAVDGIVSGVIVWAVIMAILVRDDALGYLVIWANQAIYSQLSSTLQLCGNRYALLF